VHVRIIEEETRILSTEDVAKADAKLAQIAGSCSFGKLRAAARRLVLEVDPESAERRKETAKQDAPALATPGAPPPAAVGPRAVATWTTPSPGSKAD